MVSRDMEATELRIGEALRTHPELHAGNLFRFDTFSGQTLLMHPIPRPGVPLPTGWEPCDTTDIDITHLMEWFQAHRYKKVSRTRLDAAVQAEAHRNRFSAARETLDALQIWDRHPRLDRFWIDVCGAVAAEEGMDEQEVYQRLRYLHMTARCFFISIVARIMEPGEKVDTMPVLEGPQGTLKSSLLKVIAFGRKEWLSDDMSPDVASKDAKAHLAGKLVVEMAEMHQMQASAVNALKRFLTVEWDKFRPSYGRRETVQKRQCVFVGTTNSSNYFKDETGNRRFWPIACGCINLKLAEKIMPQLYAEALAAYHAKEHWWLPDDVEIMAEIEQNNRLTDDPWEASVIELLHNKRRAARGHGETFCYVTATECLEAIETEKSRWDYPKQLRVSRILKKLGGYSSKLPRNGAYQKRGWRFITGSNGASEESRSSHLSHPNPLN